MTQKFVFLPEEPSQLLPFITELEMIGFENDLTWNQENIPPDNGINSVLVYGSQDYRTFGFKETKGEDESEIISDYAEAIQKAETIILELSQFIK